MKLANQVAIVTGAGYGIGKQYACALAKEGASVAVADIVFDAAKSSAEVINSSMSADKALALHVDVSDESSTDEMARKVIERFGRVDILVNNAGIYAELDRKPWTEISEREWDRIMQVNVKGCFLCAKAVFPQMKKQGRGKIINISSSTIWSPPLGRLHYVSSKAAVLGFTRALAREVGDYGINVNAITPGLTKSERAVKVSDEYYDQRASMRAIKRVEVPNDLVGTVIFLASSDSDFITGQTINVDGGYAFH